MAETFETLKTKMGEWLAVDTTRLPDSVRGDCINLVKRKVSRNHDLRFNEVDSTIAAGSGDRDYTLPSGWRSPLAIWYINPNTDELVPIVRISKEAFDANYPDPDETGTVTEYAVWGNVLYLGKTPESAFTLHYTAYEFLPDYADGSPNNTDDFMVQAWDVLFFGALEEASKYLMEDARAAIWGTRFAELEADLAGEHQRERSAGRVPQSREPS